MKRMHLGEAIDRVEALAEAAGGSAAIRDSEATRLQFLLAIFAMLRDVDGRTAGRMLMTAGEILDPELAKAHRRVQQRAERMLAIDAEYRRLHERPPKGSKPSKPTCSICGHSDRLLSGGVCVRRLACARRVRTDLREKRLSV